jgi:hypothetical protein
MSKFDKAIERVRGPQTLEQRRERSKSRSGVRSQGWSIFPQERPMEGTPILVRTKDGGEVEGTALRPRGLMMTNSIQELLFVLVMRYTTPITNCGGNLLSSYSHHW